MLETRSVFRGSVFFLWIFVLSDCIRPPSSVVLYLDVSFFFVNVYAGCYCLKCFLSVSNICLHFRVHKECCICNYFYSRVSVFALIVASRLVAFMIRILFVLRIYSRLFGFLLVPACVWYCDGNFPDLQISVALFLAVAEICSACQCFV